MLRRPAGPCVGSCGGRAPRRRTLRQLMLGPAEADVPRLARGVARAAVREHVRQQHARPVAARRARRAPAPRARTLQPVRLLVLSLQSAPCWRTYTKCQVPGC